MKTRNLTLGVLAFLCLSALFYACSNDEVEGTPETETEDYMAGDNPDELCITNPSWFPHAQTPAPMEGKGSPFDTSSTTNQIFHQWSWQKFLWLTKPDNGGNPLFLNLNKVYQVDANMNKITPQAGTTVSVMDTEQAGFEEAILQSNPAYAEDGKSHTVYYSIHMNPIMFNAGTGFAKDIINGTTDPSNLESFPVGSFELKASWISVNAIKKAKRSSYYTTMVSVSNDGGTTFENMEMALLGMHVVGVVENHPEFIWATFEHNDLGPDFDRATNSASSNDDMLLFAAGSTTDINGIVYDKSTKLGKDPHKVFDLFAYGVPTGMDNSVMTNTAQKEPENIDNIKGINACVKSKLNDVWANYHYQGSLWLNTDGLTPTQQAELLVKQGSGIAKATSGSSARGSLGNANITMETFTQTFQSSNADININNLANCFSCHFAQGFSSHTSPIYISHVFDGYLNQQMGKSAEEIERLKLMQEKLTTGN
ncbi:MAG: hypothetical protein NXI10_13215 [bacterium]|nr:hypothetical protein [bacterium]